MIPMGLSARDQKRVLDRVDEADILVVINETYRRSGNSSPHRTLTLHLSGGNFALIFQPSFFALIVMSLLPFGVSN